MKNTIIALIALVSSNFSFGQLPFLASNISKSKENLPDSIKTITQYEGDILLNIREFDTSKNLIFSHYKQYVRNNWNGKYLTMITGNIYNTSGKLVKSYRLHSNTGLSIWYYEYDKSGNSAELYKKDNDYEDHDSLINKNPYHYISEITTINELINHPKIKEIESKSVKYLLLEKTYDSAGNLTTETTYDRKGKKSTCQRYEYDKENNNIYYYNEWADQTYWEYFFEYEKHFSLYTNESKKEHKKSNLLQGVRVYYDSSEKRKRISDITFYKYDDKDRLSERTEYQKGIFQSKSVHEYNAHNQVTKKLSYIYDMDKLAIVTTYIYNDEGNVIREDEKDHRSGKEKVTEYRYEYEYYK